MRVQLDDAPGARILLTGNDAAARAELLDRFISDAVVADRPVCVVRPRATHLGMVATRLEWLDLAVDLTADGAGTVLLVDDLAALDDVADRSLAAWLASPAAEFVTVVAGAPIERDPVRTLVSTQLRAYRAIAGAEHQRVAIDTAEADVDQTNEFVDELLQLIARQSIAADRLPARVELADVPAIAVEHVLDTDGAHRIAAMAHALLGDPSAALDQLEASHVWARRRDDVSQALHDLHMQATIGRSFDRGDIALRSYCRRASLAARLQHPVATELLVDLRELTGNAGNPEFAAQADLLDNRTLTPDAGDATATTPWLLLLASRARRSAGEHDMAIEIALAALAAARIHDDSDAETHALEAIALGLSDLGRLEDAARVAQLVGDLLQVDGATSSFATTALWSALLDTKLLRHDRVVRICRAAVRSLERTGSGPPPAITAALLACTAAAYVALGELDSARRESNRAVDLLATDLPELFVDLVVTVHLGVLTDLGDERALARRRTEWLPLVSGRAVVAQRMRMADLRHRELRDGWSDELEQLALELPVEDEWDAIVVAQWLARMGALHGADAALARAAELVRDLDDVRDPRERLMVRGVRALVAFAEDPAGMQEADALVDAWAARGMRLDAARTQLANAVLSARHGDGVGARRRCAGARDVLIAVGARHDAGQADLVDEDIRRRRVGRRRTGRSRPTAAAALPTVLRSQYLSDAVRERLQPLVTWLRVDADAVLFEAGAPARYLYVVHSGIVRLTRGVDDLGELTVWLAGPSDIVGDAAARSPEEATYRVTAHALGDVVVARLHADDVRDAMQELLELREALHELIANRAEIAMRQAYAIAYLPVTNRLAGVLDNLAGRFGHPTLDGGVLIHVPITQAHIASMIGATRQTTSRAMGELVELGIVEQRERRVLVRDMAALSNYAAG